MSDIFVSYSRVDKERVRLIVDRLKSHGWSCFIDDQIPAGKPWPACLADSIEDAGCVLVFCSLNASKSGWVDKEITYADGHHIPIVPVKIDSVELPIQVTNVQFVDLTLWNADPQDSGFVKLVGDIDTIVSKRSTAIPDNGIAEIISLFEAPDALTKAFNRAEREINFKSGDRKAFRSIRRKYDSGIGSEEKNDLIKEVKNLLSRYSNEPQQINHSLNLWHHFDKKKLKGEFDKLRWHSSKLKILFIEYNNDPLSLDLHEILFSYYKSRSATASESIGSIKLKQQWCLRLDQGDFLHQQWEEFMESEFDGLSWRNISSSVASSFNERNLGDKSHFVVQTVDGFDVRNFNRYLRLWNQLNLEKPLFLFFYVNVGVLALAPSGKHILKWSCDIPDEVSGGDFNEYFKVYDKVYDRTSRFCEELCRCEPMSFLEALRRLQIYDLHC